AERKPLTRDPSPTKGGGWPKAGRGVTPPTSLLTEVRGDVAGTRRAHVPRVVAVRHADAGISTRVAAAAGGAGARLVARPARGFAEAVTEVDEAEQAGAPGAAER